MFNNILSEVDRNLNKVMVGEDLIAIYKSDNLLKESDYAQTGFFIKKILNENSFLLLKERISNYIKNKIEQYLNIKIGNFKLEDYHKYIQNDENHYRIANWELDVEILNGLKDEIKNNIAQELNSNLKLKKIVIQEKLQEIIGFRVIRPLKNDENPFHRDSWMEQWENTINVWIPIAGCNKDNSLAIIENSHLWNESKICRTENGVVYNNKNFRVAAAISTDYEVNVLIPAPEYGEALIFSPYLIHGNAKNRLTDTTRVSIEIRYERDISY